MEALFGVNSTVFGPLGVFAAIVSIIVQVLKNVFPKRFPTRLLTLIVSLIVVVGYTLFFTTFTPASVALSVFSGFVVAFISMFGFDSLKDIVNRYSGGGTSNGKQR